MTIIESSLSCWQAARRAIRLVNDPATRGAGENDVVGINAVGEVVVGAGDDAAITVRVATVENVDSILCRRESAAHRPLTAEFDYDSGELATVREVADLFWNVATDYEGYLPPVRMDGPSGPATLWVRFALASARDRIERHVVEGCPYCARPRHVFPEAPERWNPVAVWENRWRTAGLTLEEAALWTELTDCRPDVALELRASGLTPAKMVHYHEEHGGSEPGQGVGQLPDRILNWVRSGFSWEEIEKLDPEVGCTDEIAIARELRLRGVSDEEAGAKIDVDGESVFLWDFLYMPRELEGTEQSLDEKFAWLEERGLVPKWAA